MFDKSKQWVPIPRKTNRLVVRNMREPLHFFGQDELVYRLTKGLEKREQEVVFLAGSGLSVPVTPGAPGVFSTNEIINLVRQEFAGDSAQLAFLTEALDLAKEKKYQAAFLFLQGRLGQAAANEIVRRAVLGARPRDANLPEANASVRDLSDDDLRFIDFDQHWELNPGTEALGKLIAHYPKRFGKIVLTTNFDPLIEVAITRAGGEYFKTALHADGNLSQTEARGCHVAHLHGYWYGSDTLHTVSQLQHSRPHLRASLASLVRNKLIVVSGYGGWDDVFTDALLDAVCDDAANPEILWTFYEKTPCVTEHLESRISAGINRGRVSLYAGADCNVFLPRIYEAWTNIETRIPRSAPTAANRVRVSDSLRIELETVRSQLATLQGDDEDRPPIVGLCIGREAELQQIRESRAKVVFITGIGGQGKSTLAAQYFASAQQGRAYSYFVWRDCKEESERFEN